MAGHNGGPTTRRFRWGGILAASVLILALPSTARTADDANGMQSRPLPLPAGDNFASGVDVVGKSGIIPPYRPAPRHHDPNDPSHWYDEECCSLRDCRPIDSLDDELRFHWTTNGYHVPYFQLMIPENDPRIRRSKDHKNHICVSGGTTPYVRCIYVSLPRI